MNNDYPNPSALSNNTWSSTGQSTNPSSTNNSNQQSQATSSTTTSFNNYSINTKWGAHNSSQSSTPTNPSTLTATFPSCMYHYIERCLLSLRFCDIRSLFDFLSLIITTKIRQELTDYAMISNNNNLYLVVSSGIPPLYPSISAQSSNSINQGGAPSPFAHHHGGIPPHQNIANTPTNQTSAYAFNAAQQLNTKVATNNNSNQTATNASNPSLNTTNTNSNNNSRPSTAGGHGGGISQSSSSSSLTGLTGGISKLQINTSTLNSYNPYSGPSGFTPYAGGHTPTGNNSAANTPNPGNSTGATPTGFRFSV